MPRLLVPIPIASPIMRTELDSLPAGVTVGPGEIRIEATSYRDAAEKLVALALAMGRADPEELDRLLAIGSEDAKQKENSNL